MRWLNFEIGFCNHFDKIQFISLVFIASGNQFFIYGLFLPLLHYFVYIFLVSWLFYVTSFLLFLSLLVLFFFFPFLFWHFSFFLLHPSLSQTPFISRLAKFPFTILFPQPPLNFSLLLLTFNALHFPHLTPTPLRPPIFYLLSPPFPSFTLMNLVGEAVGP